MGIQVKLETVTPLFLGGANPSEPELRAASVRGALRFWLRALLGGVLGDNDLDALRKAENAVFGSTDTHASRVVVKIAGTYETQEYRPLPHKDFTLTGIKPGNLLTLTLAPRPSYDAVPEKVWHIACVAFLIFALFGGIGKRSRRGFGSFALLPVDNSFPLQAPNYSDVDKFSKQLPSLIQEAGKAVESFVQTLGLEKGSPSNRPHFAVFHEQHTKVLLCKKSFNSWEEAMKMFWRLLRANAYRDNPVFGFAGKAGRQASPLHLRIVKVGSGYHLLMTAFRVEFRDPQPKWEVMQNFLDECKQKCNGEWTFGGNVTWR